MSLLTKILIVAIVGYLAWTFLRKSNILGGARRAADVPPKGRPTERTIEDMVKCPKCGSYVPEKGGHDCAGA